MKIELIKGILTLNINMVATLAISVLLLLLGYYLRKKVYFFEKFCIPAPVIGGILFSILALILKQSNVLTIKMDTLLQAPLMVGFFTTVGLGGSFKLLKKGGIALIIYWLMTGVMSILQNVIGASLAMLTGIHPILGIMAGAVTMVGGHGGAASFGATAESLGVTGAVTVGMAAATFGLISGGLIGGPIAKYLIEKNNLKPNSTDKYDSMTLDEAIGADKKTKITTKVIMVHLAVITVCMTIGSIASGWFSAKTGVVLPDYVGAMFIAVILRNINDKVSIFKLDFHTIDLLSDISLGIFLSMAMMSLKLWELTNLAIPLLIILIAQVLFMVFFAIFIAFRLLGKDFDAAVMVSGFAGHGLGATPNALANMGAVSEKYGPSPKAFLIVPLVGAFLVDLIHIPNIVWFINFFK